jgi:hypothetical protein
MKRFRTKMLLAAPGRAVRALSTRPYKVEVQQLPDRIRILDLGAVVAEHPVLEGRKQYCIDRSHRTGGSARRKINTPAAITLGRIGDHVPTRPLAVYQAIGTQLALGERP